MVLLLWERMLRPLDHFFQPSRWSAKVCLYLHICPHAANYSACRVVSTSPTLTPPVSTHPCPPTRVHLEVAVANLSHCSRSPISFYISVDFRTFFHHHELTFSKKKGTFLSLGWPGCWIDEDSTQVWLILDHTSRQLLYLWTCHDRHLSAPGTLERFRTTIKRDKYMKEMNQESIEYLIYTFSGHHNPCSHPLYRLLCAR